MDDIVDIKPELRAVRLIELCDDLDRRLLARVRAEHPLANDLCRNAIDEEITLRIKRRLGEIEIERKALHIEATRDLSEASVRNTRLTRHRHVVAGDAGIERHLN